MKKLLYVIAIIVLGNLANVLFDIKYLDTEFPIQWFGLKFFQLLFDGFGFYYLMISSILILIYELNIHKGKFFWYLLLTLGIIAIIGGFRLLNVYNSESIQTVLRITTYSLIFSFSYYFFNTKLNGSS